MPVWSIRDIVLAVSLAANLLLLGFVVGAGVRLAGPAATRPEPVAFSERLSPRGLLQGLSPDARREVRQAIVGEGLRAAPLLRELREARAAFEATARAEPFDAEAVREALAQLQQVEGQLRDRSSELVITILEDLPPEERARALVEMRDRRRGFRRRSDGSRDRDGPAPQVDETP
jgi:uncharacterized membrane protein